MNSRTSPVIVSVICLAYNHEKYICKCLESLVGQKTDFAFEVLVHDDASTDGTADKIREFEYNYPNIIRPYYQKENVYSRHKVSITKNFLAPLSRGKYVAFCEGDDYWCDTEKLQKQVQIMESHSDCHLCVHRVRVIHEDGQNMDMFMPKKNILSQILPSRQLLEHFLFRDMFQTSSYFVRGEDYWEYINNPPLFKKMISVGDFPLLLYMASLGNTYFLDETMSCYRKNVIGSWSVRTKKDVKNRIKFREDIIRCLQEYDHYTDYRFNDLISKALSNWLFELDMIKGNWLMCCSDKYKKVFKEQSLRCRCSVRIHACLQWLKKITYKN